MQNKPIKKLYYSISEVSKITGLKQYVLRYWETEFPELHPAKNRAGNRIYRDKDIDLIKKIKTLLYDEKFTIEGARHKLREEEEFDNSQMRLHFGISKPIKLIEEIRIEAEEVLNLLNGAKNTEIVRD